MCWSQRCWIKWMKYLEKYSRMKEGQSFQFFHNFIINLYHKSFKANVMPNLTTRYHHCSQLSLEMCCLCLHVRFSDSSLQVILTIIKHRHTDVCKLLMFSVRFHSYLHRKVSTAGAKFSLRNLVFSQWRAGNWGALWVLAGASLVRRLLLLSTQTLPGCQFGHQIRCLYLGQSGYM